MVAVKRNHPSPERVIVVRSMGEIVAFGRNHSRFEFGGRLAGRCVFDRPSS
jgi:hypothetical protein